MNKECPNTDRSLESDDRRQSNDVIRWTLDVTDRSLESDVRSQFNDVMDRSPESGVGSQSNDVRHLTLDASRPRILLISNFKPGTGGISGQVEILLSKLRQEGMTADVFSTKGSVLYRLGMIFRLLLSGRDYDVFHVHCCSGLGFLPAVVGVMIGRCLKKRVVLTYHGGGAEVFFEKHKRLVRHMLLRTDANIVLSGFLGDVFDNYEIPYTIIPNIIELDGSRFRRRESLRPNFICIRTIDPLYNHRCIIKAFEIVKAQMPEAKLTIVGGGSIKKEIEAMVRERNLQDVTFTGRVDNSEIYRYLDQADIMISAPHIDNMPVSVLEGFNAGLLVISSRVGGVPYMIEDGVNGLLFEDDDHEELARKMIEAIDKQPFMMMDHAKKECEIYTWVNIKDKLLSLYCQK